MALHWADIPQAGPYRPGQSFFTLSNHRYRIEEVWLSIGRIPIPQACPHRTGQFIVYSVQSWIWRRCGSPLGGYSTSRPLQARSVIVYSVQSWILRRCGSPLGGYSTSWPLQDRSVHCLLCPFMDIEQVLFFIGWIFHKLALTRHVSSIFHHLFPWFGLKTLILYIADDQRCAVPSPPPLPLSRLPLPLQVRRTQR